MAKIIKLVPDLPNLPKPPKPPKPQLMLRWRKNAARGIAAQIDSLYRRSGPSLDRASVMRAVERLIEHSVWTAIEGERARLLQWLMSKGPRG